MRQELQDIKRHIYEDGSITQSEVKLLTQLFGFGFADEEAALLLELNTVLSGEDIFPPFVDLFVERLCGYVVVDGRLDGPRWEWMAGKLLQDKTIDAVERKLVEAIAARADAVPDSLKALLG